MWTTMPQRIVCRVCGTVLYDDFELESPVEIIQRHNGYCPKCHRKLNFDSDGIRIVPV